MGGGERFEHQAWRHQRRDVHTVEATSFGGRNRPRREDRAEGVGGISRGASCAHGVNGIFDLVLGVVDCALDLASGLVGFALPLELLVVGKVAGGLHPTLDLIEIGTVHS
jgi:hypothetical protein